MDSQSFDYWMAQRNLVPIPEQTSVFEASPDLVKVPSLSASPVSSTYDQFPAPLHPAYFPHLVEDSMQYVPYTLPLTPSDFGSDPDSPYCSPHPTPHVERVFSHTSNTAPAERIHTTSGRRRAQNRAAQRAFRERKEKHARDLEAQLSTLTKRYNKLEVSHTELSAAYEKLRKTIELFTQDNDEDNDAQGGEGGVRSYRRRSATTDTLRKLLDILHGEFRSSASVRITSP